MAVHQRRADDFKHQVEVLRAVRAAHPALFEGLSEAEFEALAARYAERFRREHPEAGAVVFPENEGAA